MGLAYLNHPQINKTKWDECILHANNSLIYCRSFYPDNCTDKQWDAIVLNDYEAVMPITFRKKYGISYLYQPAFLPQAGIFCKYDLPAETITAFITMAASRYKFIEINLNYSNIKLQMPGAEIVLKNNFVLDIRDDYDSISSGYKSNFKKNLKKAHKHNLVFRASSDYSGTIELFKKLYGNRFASVSEKDYQNLAKNCKYLADRNMLIIRKVISDNIVHAAVILFNDGNRLYNIASCTTPEGRKSSSNYFLYDRIIAEFSGCNLLLDLEGSDIEGIADFYMSMNPVNEQYISLRINALPPIIKLFKK